MMNKKILISVAAAATIATTFVGCGSDNNGVVGNTANGLATNSSNGTGAFTTSTGATGYAAKGPLNDFTFSENGTTITFFGGIDSITGKAPTLSVSTDTELVDEDGNIISNAYTTIAMQFDGNKTTAMKTVAKALIGDDNVSGLLKQIKDTKEDAELENKARVLSQFVKSAKAQNEMGVLTTAFAKVSDGNFTKLLETINKDLTKPLMTSDQITATVKNIDKQPSEFAKESAKFDKVVEEGTQADFNVTVVTNADINNSIVMDSNVSTDGNISALSLSGITDANITDEGGELLFAISNEATSGNNANASYALRLAKLSPVISSTTITGFTYNSNTTLELTAVSDMSKAMTFDGSDVNVSAFFLVTDLNNSLEVNATAFTNYITSIVGTDHDETNTSNKGNGNFTSGMDLNVSGAKFDYGVMLNVDSYPIVTSDKKWKAERTDVRINSKSYAGYQVVDANLTK